MRKSHKRDILESIARQVLSKYDHALLVVPQPIPIEDIMEQQYNLAIEYQDLRNDGRVLGETVFQDSIVPIYDRDSRQYTAIKVKGGTVILDASLLDAEKDGRYRFTCAHELAHWIIHKDLYGDEPAAMTETERSSKADKQIESEADCLASFLLMPKGTVRRVFFDTKMSGRERIQSVADFFGVSRTAMEIRLREMGLVS